MTLISNSNSSHLSLGCVTVLDTTTVAVCDKQGQVLRCVLNSVDVAAPFLLKQRSASCTCSSAVRVVWLHVRLKGHKETLCFHRVVSGCSVLRIVSNQFISFEVTQFSECGY